MEKFAYNSYKEVRENETQNYTYCLYHDGKYYVPTVDNQTRSEK